MRGILSIAILVLSILGVAALPAQALTIRHGDPILDPLSASVDFTLIDSNSKLQVVLTNTSMVDVLNPTQVLTAVFFAPLVTLTPFSAVLTSGSVVFFDGAPSGGVVGGEWAYKAGLAGAPAGTSAGISTAGLGLFGGPSFPGADLDSPIAVDGLNYGILSAGDDITTGNPAVTGGSGNPKPLINNSVTFTFRLNGNGLLSLNGDLVSGIIDQEHVAFQYGTSLGENLLVPEAATLLLMGSGLIGVSVLGRWFRKQG